MGGLLLTIYVPVSVTLITLRNVVGFLLANLVLLATTRRCEIYNLETHISARACGASRACRGQEATYGVEQRGHPDTM